MPTEPLHHSGTRRIECMEEMGDASWELDRASQVLTFTDFVKTTEGIGGMLVSSTIHHITLELVLPLERMLMTLNLDGLGEGPNPPIPRGPRPRIRRTTRIRFRSPVYHNFVETPDVHMYDNGIRVNPGSNASVEPEEDPSEDSGHGGVDGDLSNRR
ncbi:unnamed protein product [Trifolium pratense]|uniref:Uncharacterized protein n=1 Tax=Trifolium pratense TaxID=57577 RepID=A0ACB0KZU7_TRIPR|nr:unnamed protein product [Trifolium pratense]